jgi:putative N-acetylmannosamine-6-phosphate epimerase
MRAFGIVLVCEGRLLLTDDVRRAFDSGAFAVVVAITGINLLVQKFADPTPLNSANAAA